jgi:murein L,D-transpeptidase YcbB/YkuD
VNCWGRLIIIAALGLSACAHHPDERERAAQAESLRAALNHPPAHVGGDTRSTKVWDQTRQFYTRHDALVWSDGRTPNARAEDLARAIGHASQEGLEPSDYQVAAFDPAHAGDVDVQATYRFFQYAFDLSHGTIDPEAINPQWHPAPRDADAATALSGALNSNRVEEALQTLAPHAPQYVGLKHQLAACHDAECRGRIAMNMDRWRWLPDDLGSRYLIVNIPAYRLDAIEDGKSVLEMKVVTGKKDKPTPVLADRMTTVVFSPSWNIPDDIVAREILPKVENDPEYLARNNMEVDDKGRYRQLPGKGNSLGDVKFVFPNHFNVYLHDTPSKGLFDRVERDFSHGCVRVEQPLVLAQYVLRDQPEWTEQRIRDAMASGTERSVALKQPLPIYLVYFTAWEENGSLKTAADVYGHDRRHTAATAAAP